MTATEHGDMTGTGSNDLSSSLELTRQEIARADIKATALLTITGIGFTAFSAAAAGAVAAPVQGAARWLTIAALAGVTVVVELLLLVLRPQMSQDLSSRHYFGHWRKYLMSPDELAMDLGADLKQAKLLVQLSDIAWRKYRLIRISVDFLMIALPLISAAVAVTLISH
ncbi:Pycsar system effector family protein [Streptosporangium canum]|uniref:Pycsar system effector family protein n=1 Tax=Streptosporangium canum TaxID=324952 RepID=UPI003692C739